MQAFINFEQTTINEIKSTYNNNDNDNDNIKIPFENFLQIIKEVTKFFNETLEIYKRSDHNKRICGIMLNRIQIIDTILNNLKIHKEEDYYYYYYDDSNLKNFFSTKNFINLNKLLFIIIKIRKLTLDISQLKGLYKYIHGNDNDNDNGNNDNDDINNINNIKNVENFVKNLKFEFDSIIKILNFPLMVNFDLNLDEEDEKIKADIEDLNEYLQTIESGLTTTNKNISEIVVQLSALNNTMNKITDESIINIFHDEFLPCNDFEKLEEKEGEEQQRSIRRYKRKKNDINDLVALKLVLNKDDNIKSKVKILTKLEKCNNIIKFFGLTIDDNDKVFLVMEWAKYGNLREYYKKYGPLSINKKLRFSVDIARGLNFLRAIGIDYAFINAKVILITDHETAKIGNFSSIGFPSEREAILDNSTIQYRAPETLSSKSQRHDAKSVIYSFGILLWEIAEERSPDKENEAFSKDSPLPKQYQEISRKAINDDASSRPSIAKIFMILYNLYKNDGKSPPSSSLQKYQDDITVSNFVDFNYMTVDRASIQHNIPNGKREIAFKCFETYSDLGDMKAKYFKAYYIQHDYVKLDMSQTEKDRLVANLFREVADLDGDEYPEAQLRYGYCLFKGIGVEKNLKEALIYFTKSAENYQVIGMFNAGSLYLSGDAGKKDSELGEKYMKLAAYNQYKPAIQYCKNNNIIL